MPTIDQVQTADAQPLLAPYRVSNQSGRNTATVTVTFEATRWWGLYAGASAAAGTKLHGAGGVCGITRCGPANRLANAPAQQRALAVAAADLPAGADGARNLVAVA